MQLIAIAYPDTATATAALEELERLGRDFVIRRDEMAVIVRDEEGVFTSYTNAEITTGQPPWAMFWAQLFAMLFFVPVLKMPLGSDLAPIVAQVERSGLDPLFEERIRDELAPGTSALFFLVAYVSPDDVVAALDPYGGTVLQTELSAEAEEGLQRILHGRHQVA